MVGESDFLRSLRNFDEDDIPPATFEEISTSTPPEDFQVAKAKYRSVAAGGICQWVGATETYDRVAEVVVSEEADPAVAETGSAEATEKLNGKRVELRKVLDRSAELATKLNSVRHERQTCCPRSAVAIMPLERCGRTGHPSAFASTGPLRRRSTGTCKSW